MLRQPQALFQKLRPRVGRRTGFWVTAREAFWIALEALRAHKLRSFLTLLGVVIAATTLIVVMSVINGLPFRVIGTAEKVGGNTWR